MKTTGVLLAILAAVSAQKQLAYVNLEPAPGTDAGAELKLATTGDIQNDISITGTFFSLEAGEYVLVVHAGNEFTGDCNTLGPVAIIKATASYRRDHPYMLAVIPIEPYAINEYSGYSIEEVLRDNPDYQFINRPLGLYRRSTFELKDSGMPAEPSLACGLIYRDKLEE